MTAIAKLRKHLLDHHGDLSDINAAREAMLILPRDNFGLDMEYLFQHMPWLLDTTTPKPIFTSRELTQAQAWYFGYRTGMRFHHIWYRSESEYFAERLTSYARYPIYINGEFWSKMNKNSRAGQFRDIDGLLVMRTSNVRYRDTLFKWVNVDFKVPKREQGLENDHEWYWDLLRVCADTTRAFDLRMHCLDKVRQLMELYPLGTWRWATTPRFECAQPDADKFLKKDVEYTRSFLVYNDGYLEVRCTPEEDALEEYLQRENALRQHRLVMPVIQIPSGFVRPGILSSLMPGGTPHALVQDVRRQGDQADKDDPEDSDSQG